MKNNLWYLYCTSETALQTSICVVLSPSQSSTSPYCDMCKPHGSSLRLTIFILDHVQTLHLDSQSLSNSQFISTVLNPLALSTGPCNISSYQPLNLNYDLPTHPPSTRATSAFDKTSVKVKGLSPLGCDIVFVLLWKHVKNPILKWKCNKLCYTTAVTSCRFRTSWGRTKLEVRVVLQSQETISLPLRQQKASESIQLRAGILSFCKTRHSVSCWSCESHKARSLNAYSHLEAPSHIEILPTSHRASAQSSGAHPRADTDAPQPFWLPDRRNII